MQRVTAVALIPLSLWLIIFLDLSLNAPYQETVAWLVEPFHTVCIVAWILAVFITLRWVCRWLLKIILPLKVSQIVRSSTCSGTATASRSSRRPATREPRLAQVRQDLKARTRIKAWVKTEEAPAEHPLGKELLEKDLRKHDLNPSKVFKSDDIHRVAHEMSSNTVEDMLAAIGYGKVSAHLVANKLAPERPHGEPLPKKPHKKPAPEKKGAGSGMNISGMDSMLFHLSKCCNPVPGTALSVHHARAGHLGPHDDCPNVSDLALDRERVVEVSWATSSPRRMPSRSPCGPRTSPACCERIVVHQARPRRTSPRRGHHRQGQAGHPQLHHRYQGCGPSEPHHQVDRRRRRGGGCQAGERRGNDVEGRKV